MELKTYSSNNKEKNIFFITVFITSLVFTKYYFLFTNEYYPPAQSDLIAKFEADKVFQKRYLIPIMASALTNTFDLSFDQSLKFLILLSTIALIYGFNEMLNLFNSNNTFQFLSFFVLVPIFWNYAVLNSIFHAYDLPTLTFFCWGIVLFIKNKFLIFYILFAIATLNRESTCFITVSIFLLNFEYIIKDKSKGLLVYFKINKALFLHTFLQFLIWLGIVYFTKYLVKDNPGLFYEETFSMIHFLECMMRNDACWPYLDPNSFLSNPRSFLTLFLGLWIFIPIFWGYIPSSSKRLLLLIPVYLIPCILYANLMESRVYHELNIIISLAIVLGLHNFFFKNQFQSEVDHS